MTDSDKAFVKEVIRLINEASTIQHRYDNRTVILVSPRFFKLGKEQSAENDKTFGRSLSPDDWLCVCGMLACPAHWLRNYSFEIRPYGDTTIRKYA